MPSNVGGRRRSALETQSTKSLVELSRIDGVGRQVIDVGDRVWRRSVRSLVDEAADGSIGTCFWLKRAILGRWGPGRLGVACLRKLLGRLRKLLLHKVRGTKEGDFGLDCARGLAQSGYTESAVNMTRLSDDREILC